MKLPNYLKNKWVQLTYSPHALQRLEERCRGCLMLKPNNVKLTNNNVIWWEKNEEKHIQLKIKINYNRQQNMILIIQLDGLVKTVYYERKISKYNKIINNRKGIDS
jgi:hypothetical protein